MGDTRVLFIGRLPAHVDAAGGERRTHQLLNELESHFGRDAVLFLTTKEIFDNTSDRPLRLQDIAMGMPNRVLKAARFRAHAAFLRAACKPVSRLRRLSAGVMGSYRRRIEKLPKLAVCIVEEPSSRWTSYDQQGFRH